MATTPVVLERFGGLNLVDDPFEIGAGGATAMSNVDLSTARGRLRGRDGVSTPFSSTVITGVLATYVSSGSYVLCRTASGVTPVRIGGADGTSTSAFTPVGPGAFARTNSRIYGCGGVNAIYRYDGAWTSVAMPASFNPSYLAVMPISGRIVAANGSRVHFGDAGASETFGVNNWVDLWPGDGETIAGLIVYRDALYVFKQSRFAVFYSEGIDADGEPVFNYRGVDTRNGLTDYGAGGPLVVGDEGVYFTNANGVYLTTGDTPVLISRTLGLPMSTGNMLYAGYHRGRLYLTNQTIVLVFDPNLNAWMRWDLPNLGFITGSPDSAGLWFAYTNNRLSLFGSSTDNGTAIDWSYTTGKYPLGEPGKIAVASESSIDGIGTVTLSITSDKYTAAQSGSATLGTSPTVTEGWPAGVDQEGRWVQSTLSGSGTAQVARLTHHVNSQRQAS